MLLKYIWIDREFKALSNLINKLIQLTIHFTVIFQK
jgi:hypothetical protein